MANNLILVLSLLAVVILLVMMNITTPTQVGPLGVLVFFTMIYIVMFGVATLLMSLLRKLMGKKRLWKKDYIFASVLAFAPILILLMQSFSNRSPLLIAGLVGVVEILGLFLVSKKA